MNGNLSDKAYSAGQMLSRMILEEDVSGHVEIDNRRETFMNPTNNHSKRTFVENRIGIRMTNGGMVLISLGDDSAGVARAEVWMAEDTVAQAKPKEIGAAVIAMFRAVRSKNNS